MERRVNAVVLNYNQNEAARLAADELNRSRAIEVDVLVVDAASEAADREMLRQNVSRDRLLLLQENRGYASGMNAGISFWQARAPDTPILLVTPDCRVPEDVALALWQGLDAEETVGAAGPIVVYREAPRRRIGAGGRTDVRRRRIRLNAEIQAATPYDVDWIEGCCMLLRPQALEAVGGLDEDYFLYYEEVDLCQRLWRAGWRVRVVPTVYVRHPKATGQLPAHYYYYMTRNGYRFWAKNFGVRTVVLNVETVRATLWLAAVAIVSMLLPARWREVRSRWRDWWLQVRGAWAGTRDHLSGRYGPRQAPMRHPG